MMDYHQPPPPAENDGGGCAMMSSVSPGQPGTPAPPPPAADFPPPPSYNRASFVNNGGGGGQGQQRRNEGSGLGLDMDIGDAIIEEDSDEDRDTSSDANVEPVQVQARAGASSPDAGAGLEEADSSEANRRSASFHERPAPGDKSAALKTLERLDPEHETASFLSLRGRLRASSVENRQIASALERNEGHAGHALSELLAAGAEYEAIGAVRESLSFLNLRKRLSISNVSDRQIIAALATNEGHAGKALNGMLSEGADLAPGNQDFRATRRESGCSGGADRAEEDEEDEAEEPKDWRAQFDLLIDAVYSEEHDSNLDALQDIACDALKQMADSLFVENMGGAEGMTFWGESPTQVALKDAAEFVMTHGGVGFSAACEILGELVRLGVVFDDDNKSCLIDVLFKGLQHHDSQVYPGHFDTVDQGLIAIYQVAQAEWLAEWSRPPESLRMQPRMALRVLKQCAETQFKILGDDHDMLLVRLLWIIGFVAHDRDICEILTDTGWVEVAMQAAATKAYGVNEISSHAVRLLENLSLFGSPGSAGIVRREGTDGLQAVAVEYTRYLTGCGLRGAADETAEKLLASCSTLIKHLQSIPMPATAKGKREKTNDADEQQALGKELHSAASKIRARRVGGVRRRPSKANMRKAVRSSIMHHFGPITRGGGGSKKGGASHKLSFLVRGPQDIFVARGTNKHLTSLGLGDTSTKSARGLWGKLKKSVEKNKVTQTIALAGLTAKTAPAVPQKTAEIRWDKVRQLISKAPLKPPSSTSSNSPAPVEKEKEGNGSMLQKIRPRAASLEVGRLMRQSEANTEGEAVVLVASSPGGPVPGAAQTHVDRVPGGGRKIRPSKQEGKQRLSDSYTALNLNSSSSRPTDWLKDIKMDLVIDMDSLGPPSTNALAPQSIVPNTAAASPPKKPHSRWGLVRSAMRTKTKSADSATMAAMMAKQTHQPEACSTQGTGGKLSKAQASVVARLRAKCKALAADLGVMHTNLETCRTDAEKQLAAYRSEAEQSRAKAIAAVVATPAGQPPAMPPPSLPLPPATPGPPSYARASFALSASPQGRGGGGRSGKDTSMLSAVIMEEDEDEERDSSSDANADSDVDCVSTPTKKTSESKVADKGVGVFGGVVAEAVAGAVRDAVAEAAARHDAEKERAVKQALAAFQKTALVITERKRAEAAKATETAVAAAVGIWKRRAEEIAEADRQNVSTQGVAAVVAEAVEATRAEMNRAKDEAVVAVDDAWRRQIAESQSASTVNGGPRSVGGVKEWSMTMAAAEGAGEVKSAAPSIPSSPGRRRSSVRQETTVDHLQSAVNEAVATTRRDMAASARQAIDLAVAKVRHEMTSVHAVLMRQTVDEAVAAARHETAGQAQVVQVTEMRRRAPTAVLQVEASPANAVVDAAARQTRDALVAALQARIRTSEELVRLQSRVAEQEEVMELQAIFLQRTERDLHKELRDNETMRCQLALYTAPSSKLSINRVCSKLRSKWSGDASGKGGGGDGGGSPWYKGGADSKWEGHGGGSGGPGGGGGGDGGGSPGGSDGGEDLPM